MNEVERTQVKLEQATDESLSSSMGEVKVTHPSAFPSTACPPYKRVRLTSATRPSPLLQVVHRNQSTSANPTLSPI